MKPTDNNDKTPSPKRLSPRLAVAIGLVLATAVGATVAEWKWQWFSRHFMTQSQESPDAIEKLSLNFNHPDALIESEVLADLPKDLLTVPLLHDTLTEDFVFYYQANADRLGLAGSLRRIAYEHKLTLQDSLIADLLSQPAQLALWRSVDGKLTYSLLRIKTGMLAKASLSMVTVMQAIAEAAGEDTQLKKSADMELKGEKIQFYSLRYLRGKSLLFAYHNGYLIVLSDPAMVLDSENGKVELSDPALELIGDLFNGKALFPEYFGLTQSAVKHRISIDAGHLAMGYQAFFPLLAGLRFEMDNTGWHSFMAVNDGTTNKKLNVDGLWHAIPADAGMCFALPLATDNLQDIAEKLPSAQTGSAEVDSMLTGAAALCWYGNSRLHTPLLALELAAKVSQPETDTALSGLFTGIIGSYEKNIEGGRLPVDSRDLADGKLWQRVVGSRYGLYSADQAEPPLELESPNFFRVSLARHGNTLLFSLDDKLLQHALDTLDKNYPALSERVPAGSTMPIYLSPGKLATLLELEAMDSLPADQEAIFRNAAEQNLLPKIRALQTYPDYRLLLPQDIHANSDWQWQGLEWKPL
ncbi:DUF2138 family protein [Candidatus Methylobacter oryzae]|uniref:DUF2138 family protein n=1 Tax=Candidatus Methylobacter oryzae TaxID=2497749 RepID=A0ABY3CE57_9GAMM|nr:DUF2138 family protein [Candidatus Methylobacter oryzae]TRX01286.1 DUF2138 family protein [Candidatus Methylobacter oryzae]